ncbi:MAG TPA: sel1 repeat family protein [Myxococcales bacterium]|nr:sel1 repeat family protein [Myxococcales bacterium]
MYDSNDSPIAMAKALAFPDLELDQVLANVQNGDVVATVMLGNYYEAGHKVEKNFEEAAKLYQRAAATGDRVAEFYLAMCYDAGTGIERDKEKAFSLYLSSAEKGAPLAQMNLAHCYARAYGCGGEPNWQKAAEWYQKAAQNGVADGWYFLGYLSEGAELGEPNIERALEFYNRAAEAGSQRAITLLEEFRKREASATGAPTEITITENTVAEINDIRVGAACVWDDDYVSDEGQSLNGPTAKLSVMGDTPETDFDVKAYVGKVVSIAGEQWRVTVISEPPDGFGSVTLARVN